MRSPSSESEDLADKSISTETSTSPRSLDSNDVDEQQQQLLAKKETRAVFRLRVLVFFVLLLAALVVSLVVYFITDKAQDNEMEAGFQGSALKVLDSFQEIVEQKVGAVASLAVTFTASARSQNSTWPFVTMNDFQQQAASARGLSNSLFLELLPIVTNDTRLAWERYALENKGWLDEGRAYQDKFGIGIGRRDLSGDSLTGDNVLKFVEGSHEGSSVIADKIFYLDESWAAVPDPGPGPFFPIWQSSPILTSPRDLVNYNLVTYGGYGPYIELAAVMGEIAIGGIDTAEPGDVTHKDLTTSFFAFIKSYSVGKLVDYEGDPMSSVYLPVFDSFDDDKRVVAVLVAIINWATYFENILPPNSKAVTVVLENSCDGPFTYRVHGESVEYVGKGDQHDPAFSSYVESVNLTSSIKIKTNFGLGYKLNQDRCAYNIRVYPTQELYYYYQTNLPMVITVAVILIFLFTAFMFLVYDRLVERRQKIVLNTALKSSQIVSSLFPQQIRDRLFADEYQSGPVHGTKTKLKSFLSGTAGEGKNDAGEGVGYKSKPIADLFTDTTILFADIVGFTAWSSMREPSQVFILLESLFKAFDERATRRGVFKVETVGDCYVAVTGLPDPRKDHAILMTRFARECISLMNTMTKKLEVALGPDTAELRLRVGIHSGPVTAGVLRGDRSRFQLFGDTMNTASRMESTSQADKIHLSQETATLLIAAGKENWIRPRNDQVFAKGKGVMQTYWLECTDEPTASQSAHEESVADGLDQLAAAGDDDQETLAAKPTPSRKRDTRLVDWNVDVLIRLLKQIVARRNSLGSSSRYSPVDFEPSGAADQTVLDEVCEIITLPKFDAKAACKCEDPESIVLDSLVVEQLRDLVTNIGSLYRNNPFHNFEHASHVTMSVVKLLSRIVAPPDLDFQDDQEASSTLHDHTYGITSDPLTQFACVLSALIHDIDHPGVPNTQLINENAALAAVYKNKSVAEQNSVALFWGLFLDRQYGELRAIICSNQAEVRRFRQLIVNSVMATDIMDKDLKALRNARWEKAFTERLDEGTTTATNRKATIVIEHLIQASDVAHTMQHWQVYRKWNERLFAEMYQAYREGRAATDPSENWYKGEIGFFDFYIIPLARKLKDCGVFGVSSDEYLNYALHNRKEWEARGQEVVAEMVQRIKQPPSSEVGSPVPSSRASV